MAEEGSPCVPNGLAGADSRDSCRTWDLVQKDIPSTESIPTKDIAETTASGYLSQKIVPNLEAVLGAMKKSQFNVE